MQAHSRLPAEQPTPRFTTVTTVKAVPNRLATSNSPYLLQHRDNPVDWHEWGDEAFAIARDRDVPVLLSVGYATCHWCHVMAHESFEHEPTALYMNRHFVNVKVDREERPDIDRIYMDAVQAMTGRGGWPMTVFLTPEGKPFFAGTYFPREAMGHHPSFMHVMESVVDAWHNRRSELVDQAGRLTAAVNAGIPAGDGALDATAVDRALGDLVGRVDWDHGGFGGAPKFPQAPNLELAVRAVALDPAGDRSDQLRNLLATTLHHMAAGGIHDQLGGGFSRYGVDRYWLVPHFEKMLYDNALLARLYLRASQVVGDVEFAGVARSTLDYLLRDLADPGGGFHSGEDADSEGEEGKFYVWSWDELKDALGDDVEIAAAALGAVPEGNFEGVNVLHRPHTIEEVAASAGVGIADVDTVLDRSKRRLLGIRSRRVRPSVDDKIVTAWNGLALRAFAEAAAVLDEDRYLQAALGLASFVADELFTPGGRLVRTWRAGKQGPLAFCDDYAALAVGLFTLFQVSGDTRWFDLGERLTQEAIRLFATPEGGFYASGSDAARLIARPINLMDNPTPSDNALMAEALQMLIAYTGDPGLTRHLDGIYAAASKLVNEYPAAVGHLLSVGLTGLHGPKEVAIVGEPDDRRPLEAVVWESFRPDCVLAAAPGPTEHIPLLAGRTAAAGRSRAYVCRDFICELPVDSPEALRTLL